MAKIWTWETGSAEIEKLLDLAAKVVKSAKGDQIAAVYIKEAKDIWNQIRHLNPVTAKEAALEMGKSVKQWSNVAKATINMPKPAPPPLPAKPIDVEKTRMFGQIKFQAVNPMLILQLKEWFLEYYVSKYGDDKLKADWDYRKRYNDYFWYQLYFSPNPKPSEKDFKEWEAKNMA